MKRTRLATLSPAAIAVLACLVSGSLAGDVAPTAVLRAEGRNDLCRAAERQAMAWLAKLADTAKQSRSTRPQWHASHLSFAVISQQPRLTFDYAERVQPSRPMLSTGNELALPRHCDLPPPAAC